LKVNISVSGIEELLARVKKAGADVDGLVSQALEQGADLVYQDIKSWRRSTSAPEKPCLVSPKAK
jgi:hypothetical protein